MNMTFTRNSNRLKDVIVRNSLKSCGRWWVSWRVGINLRRERDTKIIYKKPSNINAEGFGLKIQSKSFILVDEADADLEETNYHLNKLVMEAAFEVGGSTNIWMSWLILMT